jgi:hypothetical protein
MIRASLNRRRTNELFVVFCVFARDLSFEQIGLGSELVHPGKDAGFHSLLNDLLPFGGIPDAFIANLDALLLRVSVIQPRREKFAFRGAELLVGDQPVHDSLSGEVINLFQNGEPFLLQFLDLGALFLGIVRHGRIAERKKEAGKAASDAEQASQRFWGSTPDFPPKDDSGTRDTGYPGYTLGKTSI